MRCACGDRALEWPWFVWEDDCCTYHHRYMCWSSVYVLWRFRWLAGKN